MQEDRVFGEIEDDDEGSEPWMTSEYLASRNAWLADDPSARRSEQARALRVPSDLFRRLAIAAVTALRNHAALQQMRRELDEQRHELAEVKRALAALSRGAAPPLNSVEDFAATHKLAGAIARTREILRELFGERAFVRVDVHVAPDTGEAELVFEAHYGLGDEVSDDEAYELHREFLRRYAEDVPSSARRRMTLVRFAV